MHYNKVISIVVRVLSKAKLTQNSLQLRLFILIIKPRQQKRGSLYDHW